MFHHNKARTVLPYVGILSTMVASGCNGSGGEPNEEPTAIARQAVDAASDAIARKAAKLGASVTGNATSAVQALPGAVGQYQTYANGVIVYTNDNGAVYLTQAIFDKWLSLSGQAAVDDGSDLYTFLGLPQNDYAAVGGSTQAAFDRGLIVVDSTGSRVVYGALYARYPALAATLGLPRSEPASEAGGAIFQVFENGELHYRSDLVEASGVWGPILTRWKAVGGVGGALGLPKGDTSPVNTPAGVQIGLKGVFENGTIYHSDATGAWELYTGDLLKDYETKYAGPAGWLGFPLGAQAVAASGDAYVDFQSGVLVNHTTGSTGHGVIPFGNLSFRYDRVVGYGGDCLCTPVGCLCGSQDVYTWLYLSTSNGVLENMRRYPPESRSNCGDDCTVNQSWSLGVANSGLTVYAWLQAWDVDDTSDDDELGTVDATYDINNLWGYYEAHDHYNAYNSDDSMRAWFYVKTEHPYDATDFRGQMWWSFHNFSTPALTYEQFAETFTDVDPDETWWHPLNKLYYKWFYQGIAKHGNCFGMSLESICAQEGRSPYGEPIHDYFPDTQDGKPLTEGTQDAAKISMESHLNVKHGYQLGLNAVLWYIASGFPRGTPDPNTNWVGSYALYTAGEYSVMSIFSNWIFDRAHTVRPYYWDPNPFGPPCGGSFTAPCEYIHIADGPEFTEGGTTG